MANSTTHVLLRYHKKKDGTIFPVDITVSYITLNGRNVLLATIRDITERKMAVDALKMSEEKYRLITENSSDVIWVFNLSQMKFSYISPSVFSLRGLTQEEAMGSSLKESMTPESYVLIMETIERVKTIFFTKAVETMDIVNEVQQPCKNGKFIWVELSSKVKYNSEGDLEALGVSRNIDERKKATEQLQYISYHDQLTGLYNRNFYEEELKRLDTRRNLPITLIMIDVNGLKLTNDAFGHNAGDALLQKVAWILKKECRADEIVARVGGDEFVILLPQTDIMNANKIIKRINTAIANEKIDNLILSISIGLAVKKDESKDINKTFKEAEDDMYRHKLSESLSMRSKTIDLIMKSLYEKNNREMLHSKRVSEICEAIAIAMDFSKEDVDHLRIAGLMHDIGKIGIDDNILNKVERLNAAESG